MQLYAFGPLIRNFICRWIDCCTDTNTSKDKSVMQSDFASGYVLTLFGGTSCMDNKETTGVLSAEDGCRVCVSSDDDGINSLNVNLATIWLSNSPVSTCSIRSFLIIMKFTFLKLFSSYLRIKIIFFLLIMKFRNMSYTIESFLVCELH
jgi:hypothetical protein